MPQLAVRRIVVLLIIAAGSASAHAGTGQARHDFLVGFLHPLLGWDHLVAMVAVGLWGAFLGKPAIWLLPLVFPMVMALGGLLGIFGVPIPAVDTGIALSAVALGCMVAWAARPPWWVAAWLVGSFAIFHGHAHGEELPQAASPLHFSLGFVLATGMLHAGGIVLGLLVRWRAGRVTVRALGAVIALVGLAFLAGWL